MSATKAKTARIFYGWYIVGASALIMAAVAILGANALRGIIEYGSNYLISIFNSS